MRRDESQLKDAISDAVELDRRTVNRAMAWSVPVVMAAVAAPAAAASGTTVATFTAPGGQGAGWTLTLSVENGRSTTVRVELLALYKNGGQANLITGSGVDVGAGATVPITVYQAAGGSANKKGDKFALTYRIAGVQDTKTVTLA